MKIDKEQQLTFKITKKRSSWTLLEDTALLNLISNYGLTNWTLIAEELNKINKKIYRNGKQCRERWHNHLDPNIKKKKWSTEEEDILLNKQLKYGNKWSIISKYLPGRTDNSIKNYFYSKLRKYIRKILKQIQKEKFFENQNIKLGKYSSNEIYFLIKKNKIRYFDLNKETIIKLILKNEKKEIKKITLPNKEKNFDNFYTGVKQKRFKKIKKKIKLKISIDEKQNDIEENCPTPITLASTPFSLKNNNLKNNFFIPIKVDMNNKLIINNESFVNLEKNLSNEKSISEHYELNNKPFSSIWKKCN